MKWYLKVLSQYADFSGRARRTEYWMFVLFNFIFSMATMLLDTLFGSTTEAMDFGFINGFYSLAVLIPSLAVGVRRLHDIGKSGWMILISLIPIIGWIWIFVLLVREGTPEENIYGANPKELAV